MTALDTDVAQAVWDFLRADDAEQAEAAAGQLLQREFGGERAQTLRKELRLLHKDGTFHWVEMRARASDFVIVTIPPLDAAYARELPMPINAATDAMFTIAAPGCFFKCGVAARTQ